MKSYGIPPKEGTAPRSQPRPEPLSGTMPISGRHSSSRIAIGSVPRVPVRVVCTPGSNMLECTHTFVTAYVATHHRPQVAQRLSVATYELLENAMNYGGISSEIVLEVVESGGTLAVRVSNESISARVSMLQAHLARVQNNAESTFMEEMKRSMLGGAPRAMLGLARVVFEAGMELKVEIEGSHVVVSAITRL